jgi:hypothetical protein
MQATETLINSFYGATQGSTEQVEARTGLRDITRRSKKEHWDNVISNAGVESRIWTLASWRKATDGFQPSPLVDGESIISDPTERATFLRDKLLRRTTAGEDITNPWVQEAPIEASSRTPQSQATKRSEQ